ncbi:MAG: hypothetical protein FWE67_05660 [Planctomycetaceae bacterium]|nr:hypothetical protein [Planctomycetaceae bacterium]
MDIPKFTNVCSESRRELLPGEVFFSVLTKKNNSFQRLDYAAENWKEPEHCFAWWKTIVPQAVQKPDKPLPNNVLLVLFDNLRLQQNTPEEQPDMLYVLTLLLVRRRLLHFENEYQDDSGQKFITVRNTKDNSVFDIPAAAPDTDTLDEIQRQLTELLHPNE